MSHTPEPWIADGSCRIQGNAPQHMYDIAHMKLMPFHVLNVSAKANAARIVACVNACAGIPDPAAELARLRHRASDLEERLAQAARLLEMHLPIGAVRAVGLLEVPAGVEQLCTELTRLREVERAAGNLLDALEPVRVDGRNTYEIGAAMKAKAALRAALAAAEGGGG